MNHHQLKILPEHYWNVRNGTKTFEIRVNDRAFQKGDTVSLFYWEKGTDSKDPINRFDYNETRGMMFKIGDVYPIDAERVVFSLLPITPTKG